MIAPHSSITGGTPKKTSTSVKVMMNDCKAGGMMIYPGVNGSIPGEVRQGHVRALSDAAKKVRGPVNFF